jgi:HNH endonuclease
MISSRLINAKSNGGGSKGSRSKDVMGRSKQRRIGLGKCIYCSVPDDLTDEHILPYALGGTLVLRQASCKACATITGSLEQRLLRGHWWPYRKKLGLQTRNPDASKELKRVKITKTDGTIIDAEMPLESFVAAMVFKLEPPAILSGNEANGEPYAKDAFLKLLGPMPTEAIVDGKRYVLAPRDNVEFPVNFHSGDLTRFLAKVAHGYAISKEGLGAFDEFYLPEFILGRTDGIQTYVGGYESPIITQTLPGGGYNRMMVRTRGDLLSVCIQLFIDEGDPPPIYEIVVGKRSMV